jgi:hypothetical protein
MFLANDQQPPSHGILDLVVHGGVAAASAAIWLLRKLKRDLNVENMSNAKQPF